MLIRLDKEGKDMSLKDLLPKVKLERESEVRKKVAIGATIGLTVGAVAGVLLAPKAGRKTREDILQNLNELPDKAKELSDKVQVMMGEVKDEITEETQKLMGEVKEVSSDIKNEIQDDPRFQKLTEITEEQVDAFKKKLK